MRLQDTMKALADPTRRKILQVLKQGRRSAGEIGAEFSISGAAVSRHLALLKEADLIRCQREGKFIFYEINLSVIQEALAWLAQLGEDTHETD
ncbi:MAG: winged helix-turn-helix transcriptional regulator [Clostridiales bacterium]|nr:winged helix-turn-helix transcriptional regulator [Clostridiales bacterium]